MPERLQRHLPWLLASLVFVVHSESPVVTSFDSGWSTHLAFSLIEEGDLDLDEYRHLIAPDDYRVIAVGDHLYSRYPAGPSIVAAPVLAALRSLTTHLLGIRLESWVATGGPVAGIERLISSLLVALTAVAIFFLARLRLPAGWALGVALVFAFCTSAWSVVSRGLWQHGPSMLLLTLALYRLVRGREEPRRTPLAGLLLAAAYTMRPTNALAVLVLTLYVGLRQPRALPRYLAWAALVAVPFVAYSVATFGTLLPPYYRAPDLSMGDGGILTASAGTLVSPGRGLFVYSPIFLFSLAGAALTVKDRRWTALDTALAGWIVLHWLMISVWFNWWGGTVFGPRLFADLIPALLYFLLPVVERLEATPGRRRWALAGPLLAAVVVSFAIHRAGATRWATWDWNALPASVDDHPSRLWDWRDPPFLRRHTPIRHEPAGWPVGPLPTRFEPILYPEPRPLPPVP